MIMYVPIVYGFLPEMNVFVFVIIRTFIKRHKSRNILSDVLPSCNSICSITVVVLNL